MRIEKLEQQIGPIHVEYFIRARKSGLKIGHHPTGPSEIWYGQDLYYYLNDLQHRVDGPATKIQSYELWIVQHTCLLRWRG